MILIDRKLTNKRFTPFVQEQESLNIPKNMQGQFISPEHQLGLHTFRKIFGRHSKIYTTTSGINIDAFTCRQRHRGNKGTPFLG